MSHFKAKMYQIIFPASVRPSVRLLDWVWHTSWRIAGICENLGFRDFICNLPGGNNVYFL